MNFLFPLRSQTFSKCPCKSYFKDFINTVMAGTWCQIFKTTIHTCVISQNELLAAILSLQTFSLLVLPAFHSGLTLMSALWLKRPACSSLDTMAHNGPLFWLDVVERSLIEYISSAIMSHPAISMLFQTLSLTVALSLLLIVIMVPPAHFL